jgi:PAS domain S-box-containing protein/putative nucleotidyltransferase with HDIG domain
LPGGDAAIGSRQDETGPSGANPRAATLACRHLLTVSALLVAGLAGRVLINPMQAIVCSALLGAVALAARRGGFVGGTTLAFGIGGLGAIGLAPGLVLSLIDPTAPFLFAAEGLLISLRFSSETALGMTSRPDEVETGHRGRWVWFRSLGASVRLRRWAGGEDAGSPTSRVDAPSRRLLEVAYEGVCQVDESGRIAYVNRRLLEMFKCRKEQVLGRKVELFVYPEDVSAFRDRLSRRRQGVSEQYEFRFRRLDGEPLWAIVSASPLNDRGGRYRGAVAMLTDFSERRRMEEQLRGHQSILRGFYDGTPMKMGVVELLDDGDLLVLSANRLMAQYNDLQVTEIEGRRVSELKVPLGKLRFLVEKFLESRRRSQAVRFDYLCKCSHGARWISATVNFLGLSDQARPRFLFVGEDVTDRKHAEEDYRGLFENASEGIYRTSRDGRLLTVNPALARIFGFDSPAQMIEEVDSFTDRCYLDPESRKAFLRRIQARGGVSGVESRVRTRQGSEIWISESGRAVLDPSGSVRFYEGIVDDITLRKLAESEIQALNDQLRRRLDWMTALSRVDSAIAEGGDLPCLLDVVLCEASRQLGVEAARVLVEKAEGASFSVGSTIGLRSPDLTNARGGFDSALLRRIVEDHQTVWADLDSLSEYPGALLVKSEGFTQLLMVPLVSRGRVQGVLEVFGRAHMDSSPEWREALETLAGQAALAIDNAALMKDLQRSHSELASAYDATIEGWARVLDLRDKETEGHSQRVTEMTVRLARSLGISEAELVHVRRGALLHDIGKMGIPDGILLKPGPLSSEEWTVMRQHPEYAYEMLSPITFLRPALDIPLNHHERWDGTGYPKGLKGEAIPLTARIFAAVDIWDALSHDRPYRQAWSPEAVREHLASLSGSHLDPDVVRSFLALLSNQPVAPTATPPDWIAGGSRDECSCVPAPLPALETERLEALWEYQVLDSEPEPAFDEIAQLAASVCETPIALISLIDTHRQWFKARVGLTSGKSAVTSRSAPTRCCSATCSSCPIPARTLGSRATRWSRPTRASGRMRACRCSPPRACRWERSA